MGWRRLARSSDALQAAARKAVNSYYESNVQPLFARRSNPFGLEPRSVEEDEGLDQDGCNAFLYVRVKGAHFPVY